MIRVEQINKEMRELLSFTVLQYMLDSIQENTKIAELYTNDDNSTCFVLLGHYLFVAGEISDEAINYLATEILNENVKNSLEIVIVFYPNDEWKNAITKIYTDKCLFFERSLYKKKPLEDFYEYSNDNSAIVKVTNDILNSKVKNIVMITDEVIGTGTYNNMKDFINRGIGIASIIDNKICGFCTSEYPTKNELAIGIEVLEEHQKKGIANSMTSLFLNEAHKKNLTVNWECWKNNIASANTALSCGFEKIADYPIIFIEF